MQVGGPTARHFMQRDSIGCSFQYDDEERPCMVFYVPADARHRSNPPICVALLDDLYKYADDGYLWRSTKEWTEILRGRYSRFEHRNLYFFVNDCLHYLLHIKPFPEQFREKVELELVQSGDRSFTIIGHA